jgi:hypothetical protein
MLILLVWLGVSLPIAIFVSKGFKILAKRDLLPDEEEDVVPFDSSTEKGGQAVSQTNSKVESTDC